MFKASGPAKKIHGEVREKEETRDIHDKKEFDPYSYMTSIDILSFPSDIFEAW